MSDKRFKEPKDPLSWPTAEDGRRERQEFLCNVSDACIEGEMTIRMLEAFGIPVIIKYEHGTEPAKAMWAFSAAGKNIYVPESMLEDAKGLLSTPPELPDDFENFGDVDNDF
mgnify:CR=1 FL=1